MRKPNLPARLLIVGIMLAAGVVSGQVGAGVRGTCSNTWTVEPSPNVPNSANFLFATATISSTEAWAVGETVKAQAPKTSSPLTLHWDGTSWVIVTAPKGGTTENAFFSVAALAPNDVWAVGRSLSTGSMNRTLAEHWNGTSWSIVPTPNVGLGDNFLQSVVAISPTAVWAVGHYDDGAGLHRTLIERWDGTAWTIVPSPNVGTSSNWLYSVSAGSAKNVWAVGTYYDTTTHALQTLTVRWNGRTWRMAPSPNSGTGLTNILLNVGGVAVDRAWAVGFTVGTSGLQALIEQWNGVNWAIVPAASVGGKNARLLGVSARNNTDVWAVGSSSQGATSESTLVQQWNGSVWNLSSSPNPFIKDNILFAGSALPTGEAWAVGYGTEFGSQQTITAHICEA